MTAALDSLMETASIALAEMDYARCEALCVEAFDQARAELDWVMVQRVLLPLQEARRQKRQAAIDGMILLGTPDKATAIESLISDERCGCIVLTQPYVKEDAITLDTLIRERHRTIEILFADTTVEDDDWTIATFNGPQASIQVPAPSRDWIGQWVDSLATQPPTPAHWFMRASESLGNAALDAVDAPVGSMERFDQLALALAGAGDHEILHQRLADAAKALHEAKQ